LKKKITIVDYGAGNILSLKRALEYLSFNAEVVSDPRSINNANYLILPGDGAFGYVVKKLKDKKIYESIINHVSNQKPFLGICIGMQLLFTESNEFGNHKGLDFIKGKIIKISTKNHTAKIPAIGWSKIKLELSNKMIKKINLNSFDNKSFYFVHSFKAIPTNKENLLGFYYHGNDKVAALVGKDNVFGTQFHPEKSGKIGLELIKKFVNL
tara:strand:+ start:132 stop:764 length:633 start_codon:yes stop_codon:yes gene_type:complete